MPPLQDGRQALHYAAAAGCIRISECLLDAGASKNRSTSNGATPFWLAAQQGHLGVVLRLCSARVDLNKSNAETWFQWFWRTQVAEQLSSLGWSLIKLTEYYSNIVESSQENLFDDGMHFCMHGICNNCLQYLTMIFSHEPYGIDLAWTIPHHWGPKCTHIGYGRIFRQQTPSLPTVPLKQGLGTNVALC